MIPEAALQRFERARAATIALVEGLSQEDMDRSPRRGGWSVGEVLNHLLRAEAANRNDIAELVALAKSGREPRICRTLTVDGLAPAYLPRSLLPLLAVPAGIVTSLVPYSLRELVIRHRLFPADTSRHMQPQRGRPAGELRAELGRSVGETRRLFHADPDLDYGRMILQHPLLGENDVPQILLLTTAHEERHQDQIRDLLTAAGGSARR